MEIMKLKPTLKDYIWGGNRLKKYVKESNKDIIAESWEISFHNDGPSIIDSGEHKGCLLKDVINENDLGEKCKNFTFFPILNKFIDAKDNLSIQVHPSDEYALKYENSYGKTEMWYVVSATEEACLYVGFNKDVTDEEISSRIQNNTLMEIMNKINVKEGDCYFIPSGTIHAIGKGCLVYEIQENSNITYRVYDYDRRDKNGNPRELHVAKALAVLNKAKTELINLQGETLKTCKYFSVRKLKNPKTLSSPKDSFMVATVIKGNGDINNLEAKMGDTFFIPANKKYDVNGEMIIITTNI